MGASSAVPLLWHETREKSPVISVVSHSPQNHLALEEPSAVLPSCVGLVEGVGPGTGFRVVRTGVLKAGETRAVTQTEVKAGVLWGHLGEGGGIDGDSETHHALVGRMCRSECLHVPPIYSHVLSFLQRKLMFSQASTPAQAKHDS